MREEEEFSQHGFFLVKGFLPESEVIKLENILQKFHENWLLENRDSYESSLINSAYITHQGQGALNQNDRTQIFKFLSSKKIAELTKKIFAPKKALFLNTQLFFDPYNPQQKNYWHRDIQYTDHTQDQQKEILENNDQLVVHFRLALRDENGIELIPGTHKSWDSSLELSTRLSLEDRLPSDPLPNSKSIRLKRGDLLAFSANMIHRGLYGLNRFAFDTIYCEDNPTILKYAEKECLPTAQQRQELETPELFPNL